RDPPDPGALHHLAGRHVRDHRPVPQLRRPGLGMGLGGFWHRLRDGAAREARG
ncbi:unnamed protein product, partial [Effrenium voratum]